MRNLILIGALLASTPALATITANGGTVKAGSLVSIGTALDTDSDIDSVVGLPSQLSALAISTLQDSNTQTNVSAGTRSKATWASATQGTADILWGYSAENGGSTSPTVMNTGIEEPTWEYAFTTGGAGGTFNGVYSFLMRSGDGLEVAGRFGTGSASANDEHIFREDQDSSRSFSIALAPNTNYFFRLYSFGSGGRVFGGLNAFSQGDFFFEWSILEGSAVPEPASWAMLITGFGLVGATARRRRAQVA